MKKRIEPDRDRVKNTFSRLVSLDSPSFGERTMADELKAEFGSIGVILEEDGAGAVIGGNSGNLFGVAKGNLSCEPILLCAHMDTVEPCKNKRAVFGADGVIQSAGDTVLGADDLTAVTAIIEALRFVTENNIPHRPIEVLLTVAEEVYGVGATAFDYSKVKAREAYVLDLDAPLGTAALVAPTIIQLLICIQGKAAHAGFCPEKGVNALKAAAGALAQLPVGHLSEDTTLNFGIIHGGTATNIVPDKCIIHGEIRSTDHSAALDLSDRVREVFQMFSDEEGASLQYTADVEIKAYRTPEDASTVKRYRSICKDMGLEFRSITTYGGSDNNILAEHGIEGIVAASAMHLCHSCEEYSTVDELRDLTEMVIRLITTKE